MAAVTAPQTGFARARAQSLAATAPARTRQGLAHVAEALFLAKRRRVPDLSRLTLAEILAVAREGAAETALEIRFYNDFPGGPLYFLRDLVLIGRCSAGQSAQRSPWFLAVQDPSCERDLYDCLNTEFTEIWATAGVDPIIPSGAEASLDAVLVRADALQVVIGVCEKFHRSVNELRLEPERIADEAAIGRILSSILRGYFETVLVEESTPWAAGRDGRIDVLLPDERIGVEVKFARAGAPWKGLVDELIVARSRYARHERCSVLVCFIYDPTHVIPNRAALIGDLQGGPGLTTHVVVAP